MTPPSPSLLRSTHTHSHTHTHTHTQTHRPSRGGDSVLFMYSLSDVPCNEIRSHLIEKWRERVRQQRGGGGREGRVEGERRERLVHTHTYTLYSTHTYTL